MKSSALPPSLIGASHLGRYVLRPDGPGGIAFTLSMYDTTIPSGDGGTWIGYRLYQRSPDGDRKGVVLFEDRTVPPSPTRDPADLAKLILDTLAVGPGDLKPDPTENYTPDQLDFATKYGRKLRKVAQEKFGWKEAELRPLRADLEISYTWREDLKAHHRHEIKAGIIQARGRTKREAVAEMREAIRNHISAVPEFRAGDSTKQVYCLYPHGSEMVIQCLRPQFPESLLGDTMRFRARDLEDAKRTFEVIAKGLEAAPDPRTKFVPALSAVVPAPNPGPTFSGHTEPGKVGMSGMPKGGFDHPIPKSGKSGTRGLPGGILQSP